MWSVVGRVGGLAAVRRVVVDGGSGSGVRRVGERAALASAAAGRREMSHWTSRKRYLSSQKEKEKQVNWPGLKDFVKPPESNRVVEEYYGVNTFNVKTMSELLPPHVFKSIQAAILHGKTIDDNVAETVATVLLQWAVERGATHYAHWFQPLTGSTAEKHNSFLTTEANGQALSKLTAKDLIRGEGDASSFPSGGLRETHMARGYTVWDPTSPPFIVDHGNGATLYIPSVFFSWDGKNLDEKIPLLRSVSALTNETLQLFKTLEQEGHHSVTVSSGLEQEFFLIDREYYLNRLDLFATGRTLLGAPPPKGQELEDQYFGDISTKALRCIHEIEIELWKLGIHMQCRHREVAPGQYELAPKFSSVVPASDNNLVAMQMIRKVARKHGLQALLHEKPFAGMNGSGKHNNWSFGTNKIPNLFEPGPRPQENRNFLLILATIVRAVSLHGDLLRYSIAGAGNDHRLGAQEAPPAIMSIFLGEDVEFAVNSLLGKIDKTQVGQNLNVDLGVTSLPKFSRQPTDRNRTSPVAFTGNKFEFRAVGSSQPPARSNTILNTILAESIKYCRLEIEKLKATMPLPQAVEQVTITVLKQHERVLFSGNSYSQAWRDEAARRGLPNIRSTPDAINILTDPKNVKLFESMSILSKDELEARKHVGLDDYVKKIWVEARVLRELAIKDVIPAAYRHLELVSNSLVSFGRLETDKKKKDEHVHALGHQQKLLHKLTSDIESLLVAIEKMNELEKQKGAFQSEYEAAKFCEQTVLVHMAELRKHCDVIESLVDRSLWPLPTYHAMLFHQN